jgi:cytochrome P450
MADRPRLNLRDPEFINAPWEHYAALQARCPVAEDPEVGALILGYDNVVAAARDNVHFSRQMDPEHGTRRMGFGKDPIQPDVQELLDRAHPETPALVFADPPSHSRHRKLAMAAFGPRQVRALEPAIRALANELIDAFADVGSVDLLERFAVPFPLFVISDMLGLEREHTEDFKRWSDLILRGLSDVLSHDERRAVANAVLEFQAFFIPRFEALRAQPQDHILSHLVNARVDDLHPLTTEELLPIVAQLTTAGHATTTNFIANAIVLVLRMPEHLEAIRAEPAAIPAFLEEVLRYDPPLHATSRRTAQDFEFNGVPMTAGEAVFPGWAAACHDPAVFPEPERFIVGRENARRHLAFGHGTHFCIGAELSRIEGRVAVETLLERLPGLELDESASNLRRRRNFSHHGYERVVLRFQPSG